MGTEHLDPDGDASPNDFTPSGCAGDSHFECINDAIRQPSTSIDGNYLTNASSNDDEKHTYTDPIASGVNVTAVKFWLYGRCGDADDFFRILPSGVVGWTPSTADCAAPGATNAWVSAEWTGLSIDILQFSGLEMNIQSRAQGKSGGSWIIETCYVELTYEAGAATYDTYISESVTATDIWKEEPLYVYDSFLSESVSAADSWEEEFVPAGGATFSSFLTETVTATDTWKQTFNDVVDKTWTNGNATEIWDDADNWSPVGVPANNHNVLYTSSYTDNCSIDVTTANLRSFDMQTSYTGTVSLNANTLNVEYVANGSDFTGTQGTFNAGSGLIKVSGDWDTSSASFVFTDGSSTVQFTGDGSLVLRAGWAYSLYNVTIDAGTIRTAQSGSDTRVSGLLTINGEIAGYYWRHRYANANPIVWGGSGSIGASFGYVPGHQIDWNLPAPSSGSYWRLAISMGGGYKCTLTGAITVTDGVNIYWSSEMNPTGTTTLDTAGYAINTNSFGVGYSGGSRPGILICGASAFDLGTNLNIYVDSYIEFNTSTWSIAGNYASTSTSANHDDGTGVITFDGSPTQTITVATTSRPEFYTMKIANSTTAQLLSNLSIGGNFGDGADDGEFQPQTYTMYVGGAWDSSSANLTFTRSTSTVQLDGTANLTVRDTGGNAFNNLNCGIGGATTTIQNYISTYGTLTVGTGELARNGAQYVYLRNTTTPLVNGGTITAHVAYIQESAVTVLGTTYGGNLWIRPSDTVVATLGAGTTVSVALFVYNTTATETVTLKTNGNQLDVVGETRIGHVDGTKFGILDCDAANINVDDINIYGTDSYLLMDTSIWTVSGSWTDDSTSANWDEGTSSVVFDGSGMITIADITHMFYDMDAGASGEITAVASNMRVANQLTLGTGQLNQSGGTRTISIGFSSTTQANPFVNGGGSMAITLNFMCATDFNVPAGTNYSRLGIEGYNGNSPPHQATLQGAITVASNLNINGRYAHLDTAGFDITHNAGNFTVGLSVYATKLKCNGSTITLNADLDGVATNAWIEFDTSTWEIAGNVSCASVSGNWDEGTGLVKYTGDSAQNIDWNGQDIYNVQLSGTGQKNITGSLRTNDVRALNDVTMAITHTTPVWSLFADAEIYADPTYTLTLRSSDDTTDWIMDADGDCIATRVDVKDSDASSGHWINAMRAGVVDSGDNTNWEFGNRFLSEDVTATDAWLHDVPAAGDTFPSFLTENVGIADTWKEELWKGYAQYLSESVSVTDNWYQQHIEYVIASFISETVTASDTWKEEALYTYLQALTEAVSVSDAWKQETLRLFKQYLSEGVSISEDWTQEHLEYVVTRYLSESVSVSDEWRQELWHTFLSYLTETVGVSDDWIYTTAKRYERRLSESVTVADAWLQEHIEAVFSQFLSEDVSVSDTWKEETIRIFKEYITEGVSVSDDWIQEQVEYLASSYITEAVSVTDAWKQEALHVFSSYLTESVTGTDAWKQELLLTISRTLSESVTVADTWKQEYIEVFAYDRFLTESVTVTDVMHSAKAAAEYTSNVARIIAIIGGP